MIEPSYAYGGVYRFFGALALVCLTRRTASSSASRSKRRCVTLLFQRVKLFIWFSSLRCKDQTAVLLRIGSGDAGTRFIVDLCNLLQSTRRHIPQDPPRESQICFLNICLDARSRNWEKRQLVSSCLSVHPHGTLDEFAWNLIFEHFSKKMSRKSKFH